MLCTDRMPSPSTINPLPMDQESHMKHDIASALPAFGCALHGVMQPPTFARGVALVAAALDTEVLPC